MKRRWCNHNGTHIVAHRAALWVGDRGEPGACGGCELGSGTVTRGIRGDGAANCLQQLASDMKTRITSPGSQLLGVRCIVSTGCQNDVGWVSDRHLGVLEECLGVEDPTPSHPHSLSDSHRLG